MSHLTFAIHQWAPWLPPSLLLLNTPRATHDLVISSFGKSTISEDLRWGFKTIPLRPSDYPTGVSRGNEDRKWSAKALASHGMFTGKVVSKPPWWLGSDSSAVSPHGQGCPNPMSPCDLPFLWLRRTTSDQHSDTFLCSLEESKLGLGSLLYTKMALMKEKIKTMLLPYLLESTVCSSHPLKNNMY